ncbi:secretin N-terminal domain-containing protein [Burkholderia territorii]|uniref:secretin N-terminal domain-containing protein n=1 Tax=Burkholderia territorii TaxID=1503055 RepID=UPI0018C4CC90|nr:secretin N-terminal domain-containing protein [Burkholderia territorii]
MVLSIIFASSIWPSAPAHAVPPASWKDSAYAYTASQESLYAVLRNFTNAFGVRLSMPPAMRKIVVESRQSATSATEYLDRLGVRYAFSWFFYNGVLYVSPISDYVTEHVQVPRAGIGDAEKALRGVGLLEPKFGWGGLDGGNDVLVSGPTTYVRLVRSLLQHQYGKSDEDTGVMIFRLKNALAADRVTTLRDRTQTSPGVATILKSLLGENSPTSLTTSREGLGETKETESTASLPPLPSLPLSITSTAGKARLDSRSAFLRTNTDIQVDADPRTNSVLVLDSPAKRAMYENLIGQLDITSTPVEISATIFDVDDRSQKEWAPEFLFGTSSHGGGVSASVSSTALDLISTSNANIALWAADKLLPRLRALESSGRAKVYANPSVMTMDNIEAVLDLSQTEYMKLIGERAVDARPISTGTMLRVMPRIQPDGRIHTYIEIEDGSIDNTGAGMENPIISRNTITTEAVLKENQAIVIGGYKIHKHSRDQSRVPLLGAIPVIGRLFTTDNTVTSTSNRVFVISARALSSNNTYSDPAAIAAAPVLGDAGREARQAP